MKEKDIRQLIERFMAGQTSIEEENLLAEYFRTHDVPEEWKAYKEMFAWFDEGMPLDNIQDGNEPNMQASTDIGRGENSHKHAILQPSTNHRSGRNTFKKLYLLIAAAAAVTMLLLITWPAPKQSMTADNLPMPTKSVNIEPATKTDTLTVDTATVNTPKNKKTRRGIRRDRYKPMPPKVYLAETRQDTISHEAKLIAEKNVKETEMQQEEILNDIYNDYKSIEAGLEIYLTALESYDVEEEYY